MSKKSIFCIATSCQQADQIVDQLKGRKFSNNNLSVLFADKGKTCDSAHDTHSKAPEGAAAGAAKGSVAGGAFSAEKGKSGDSAHEAHSKAPESAAKGGVAGGASAGVAGVGATAVPGIGAFKAAGPIVAALSGAAAAGGIAAGLTSFGIPENEAKRYEGKIKSGHVFISVQAENPDEIAQAKDIFTKAGAQDICSTGEACTPKASTPKDGKTSRPAARPEKELAGTRS